MKWLQHVLTAIIYTCAMHGAELGCGRIFSKYLGISLAQMPEINESGAPSVSSRRGVLPRRGYFGEREVHGRTDKSVAIWPFRVLFRNDCSRWIGCMHREKLPPEPCGAEPVLPLVSHLLETDSTLISVGEFVYKRYHVVCIAFYHIARYRTCIVRSSVDME
jgi:hypothetical protein